MNSQVDIVVEDPRWDAVALQSMCDRAAQSTLSHLDLDAASYEISLMACDDARIADLNGQFRGKPSPTNVLSWPALDLSAETAGAQPDLAAAPCELGDIALAWETCVQEAKDLERPLEHHLSHLVVHGILHLLGYDHIRDKDAALMETLEVAILSEIGIPDPYLTAMGSTPDNGL